MKTYLRFKYILGCLLIGILSLSFISCEDVNDWDVDESKDQMFTPAIFETSSLMATEVELKFSGVSKVSSYVIELSEDSLAFNTIIRTITIPFEELVKDETSTNVRYLLTVSDLLQNTRYSARIKAISSTNIPESKWGAITFKTPNEQIISRYSYGETTASLEWKAGLQVTHVLIKTAGAADKKTNLTAENISEGKVDLTDLEANTAHTVEIYNGETKRGSIAFTTYPKVSGDGKRYYLTGNENLQTFLDDITAETQIVLVLPAGSNYSLDAALILPNQLTSLTIWGLPGGEQPVLKLKSMNLDATVTNFKLWIQNVEIIGTSAADDYLMNDNPSNARTISEFKLENCSMHTFRGIFRMRGALTVDNIIIENCLVDNLTSYGFITSDAATVLVGNVNVKNSTISNILNGNIFTFKGVVSSSLSIENCTFYNAQSASNRYIVNFDGKTANIPPVFKITNSIFASSDASIKFRATNPKIESAFVTRSYITNDYVVDAGYPLSGVSQYSKSSTDLFEDPTEGNFKIIDATIGDPYPGDSRWWN